MIRFLLAALLGFLAAGTAQAQTGEGSAFVVASCPPSVGYTVGQLRYPTIDVNGKLCTDATGGGGGGAVTIADGADVTQGALADAAATAGGTGSISAKLRLATTLLNSIANTGVVVTNTNANGQATMANSAPVVIASNQSNLPVAPYPTGATPYTATATGTTGATTATLTGASSVTTYLCGFSIRANATAAATGNATVTGTITATLNFTQWTAPNASGLGITEMIFAPCIPASATNTSIAVVSAAPGTGGVVSVTAWGYKL